MGMDYVPNNRDAGGGWMIFHYSIVQVHFVVC